MFDNILFGFEVEAAVFDLSKKRPLPPNGFIEFNSNRAHCQSGVCPNCGTPKPGRSGGHGGFQDRAVQNLMRALTRLEKRFWNRNWKPSFDLFSTDLDPLLPKHSSMLKCHPSRYGVGEFCCCGAKIWHDFGGSDSDWKHYYKPKPNPNKSLSRWLR